MAKTKTKAKGKKTAPKKKTATKALAKRPVKRAAKKAAKKAVRKPRALARRPAGTKLAPVPAALPESMGLAALGLSAAGFSEHEKELLAAPFQAHEYELLPTGIAYVPHVHIRRRLTAIFGAGDWGLMGEEPQQKGRTIIQRWILMVRHKAIALAFGEASYVENNKRHSWGKALEGAKSSGLVRCCKDLMPIEPWDRTWQFQYRLQQGVYVNVRGRDGTEQQWRRWDSPPLSGETGIHDSSPNQERYVPPTKARRAAARASMQSAEAADDDAAAAHAVRQETTAAVPYGDSPIGSDSKAHRALRAAMKTHGTTETMVKDYIKALWGYTSTRQILKSQFDAVLAWVKMPTEYAVSGTIGSSEVVDGD